MAKWAELVQRAELVKVDRVDPVCKASASTPCPREQEQCRPARYLAGSLALDGRCAVPSTWAGHGDVRARERGREREEERVR